MSEAGTLSLEFPGSFVDGPWADETKASETIEQAALMDLYRQRMISLRRIAELPGLSCRDFQELASQHRVSLFEYEECWADRELAARKSLRPESR